MLSRYEAIKGVMRGGVAEEFYRMYLEIVLVSMPTPDFSMPFNVICLTSTALAIGFGTLHSLSTRSFAMLDENKRGRRRLLRRLQTYLLKARKTLVRCVRSIRPETKKQKRE